MKHPDYPGVSAFADRFGKRRWRYRKNGVVKYLPGEPHSPEFDAAYRALGGTVAPRPAAAPTKEAEPTKAAPSKVVPMPGASEPRTFKAAYRELRSSQKWTVILSGESRRLYSNQIEDFLKRPVMPNIDKEKLWGDIPISDLKFDHVQKLMESESIAMHQRRVLLVCIRKLVKVALRLRWMDADPTVGVELFTYSNRGDQPWSEADHKKFCLRHPIGSSARTCYGLARWLGNRRGDIAKLRWADLEIDRRMIGGKLTVTEGFVVEHEKGAHRRRMKKQPPKIVFQPLEFQLAEILAPLDRTKEFVLLNEDGEPYKKDSLTGAMRRWREQAKIGPHRTLHGLRFSSAEVMTDAEVDERGVAQVLGHNSLKDTRNYARNASQRRAAIIAAKKVALFEAELAALEKEEPAAPLLRVIQNG